MYATIQFASFKKLVFVLLELEDDDELNDELELDDIDDELDELERELDDDELDEND